MRSLDCALFCGKAPRKQLEQPRSGEKHSATSRVSPYTSFALQPLPVCFTTEQSTVKASLFVNSKVPKAFEYLCLLFT